MSRPASVVNLGRWVRELQEQPSDGPLGLVKPRFDRDQVVEACLRGDSRFHLNMGIWPGLAGVEKRNLCAHLQWASPETARSGGCHTVPSIRDLYKGSDGLGPDWLDRPVLVAGVDVFQKHQIMPGARPDAVQVWLVRPDLCDVCSPDAGQLDRQFSLELPSVVTDREVDASLGVFRERGGRRSAATNESPGKVVEAAPKVVRRVSKQQPHAHRYRADLSHIDTKAVTFWLILRASGEPWLRLTVSAQGLDLSLQRLSVTHGLRPLQPCAVEQRIMDHLREPTSPTPPAPWPASGSAHTSTARES
jgi:hypothetical protein